MARLGKGAFGKVKEATNVNTLRRMAVKIMHNKKLRRQQNGQANARKEITLLKVSGDAKHYCRVTLGVLPQVPTLMNKIFQTATKGGLVCCRCSAWVRVCDMNLGATRTACCRVDHALFNRLGAFPSLYRAAEHYQTLSLLVQACSVC